MGLPCQAWKANKPAATLAYLEMLCTTPEALHRPWAVSSCMHSTLTS